MTSVVIVADSGQEMARLTAAVQTVRGMEIVRHASGRAPVASIVASHGPALVVLGEMSPRRLTFDRLAEVRAAAPGAAVVVIAAAAGARWLARALHEGATVALPGGSSVTALGAVLQDVLTTDAANAAPVPLAA